MTRNFFFGLTLMSGAVALQAQQPTVPTAAPAHGPQISFATPVYDFGRIKAGEVVKYSYVFTNTGSALLEVTQVQPGCGCTTAGEWTRKVDPGQTGTIPVQFNSGAFNGEVHKTVTVTCNDPNHGVTVLQLKGTIWKPVEVIPQYAVFNLMPDTQTATSQVRVNNHLPEPMYLLEPESNNKSFSATIATNELGKQYTITVTASQPMNPGAVQGQIVIKTTSTNTPVITLPFYATVQPAVSVQPPQITLPAPPLANETVQYLTIQNNSTNTLSLSEPACSMPGAKVQVKELQPGRTFQVQLTLPAGFEIERGKMAYLTLKTSNPQFSEVKVPVVQLMRPNLPTPRQTALAPGVHH